MPLNRTVNANFAPRCQHIRTSGLPCGAPARRGRLYCCFHDSAVRRNRDFVLPLIEDNATLQLALNKIMQAFLDKLIDQKTATTLLYGLQIAFANLRELKAEHLQDELERRSLARRQQAAAEAAQAEAEQQEYEEEQTDEEQDEQDDEEDSQNAETVEDIQAVADCEPDHPITRSPDHPIRTIGNRQCRSPRSPHPQAAGLRRESYRRTLPTRPHLRHRRLRRSPASLGVSMPSS